MFQSKIIKEDKKWKEIRPRFKYMCSIFQGIGKIIYFLRLQKGVWLAKLYFYIKNEFCEGLEVFLVELKCYIIARLSYVLLDKYRKKNRQNSHKLPTLKI